MSDFHVVDPPTKPDLGDGHMVTVIASDGTASGTLATAAGVLKLEGEGFIRAVLTGV